MSRQATILILVGVFAFSLAALLVPNLVHPRSTKASNPCVNNLRNIDGAKQNWYLENGRPANRQPTWDDIVPWLADGTNHSVMLKCPDGGVYSLGKLGESPKCSYPEHSQYKIPQ
jgi:hypothetical protein